MPGLTKLKHPALVTDHCLVASTTLCRGQKNRFEHEHCRDRHHHRWHWYGHRLWSGQGEERREWKRMKDQFGKTGLFKGCPCGSADSFWGQYVGWYRYVMFLYMFLCWVISNYSMVYCHCYNHVLFMLYLCYRCWFHPFTSWDSMFPSVARQETSYDAFLRVSGFADFRSFQQGNGVEWSGGRKWISRARNHQTTQEVRRYLQSIMSDPACVQSRLAWLFQLKLRPHQCPSFTALCEAGVVLMYATPRDAE